MNDENRETQGEMQDEKKTTKAVTVTEPIAPAVESLMTQDWKMSKVFAKTQMVPAAYQNRAEDTFVAIQYGRELGLAPLQALQNVSVINGRPCIWGDACLALVQGSGKLEYIIEDKPNKDNNMVATCKVKRIGQPNETTGTFSWDDASKAGLTNKTGAWKNYPNRMLQLRARGFALRDSFADILKGIILREEAEDCPAERGAVTVEMPKRKSETEKPEFEGTAAAGDSPPDITEEEASEIRASEKAEAANADG